MAVAAIPLVYLVVRATSDGLDAFVDALRRPTTLELTRNSLVLAVFGNF